MMPIFLELRYDFGLPASRDRAETLARVAVIPASAYFLPANPCKNNLTVKFRSIVEF